jgi:UDP-N-acetylglucosamine 1-carboxyvinyltransferase
MASFQITGGQPLYGSIRLGGAKNASFKLMIAALLGRHESRLLNFSHISEVDMVGDLICSLGATISHRGERTLFIDPQTINTFKIPEKYGQQSRSAPMFLPILLHRFGHAWVPMPGGDKLGQRPIDWHLQALMAMGAAITQSHDSLEAHCDRLHGIDYTFPKNSHTGTETVIMAAVLAQGKTIIRNAALEPEIDDLITFLNNMGARIRRRLTRIIEIEGVPTLSGAIHRVMPDRNEAVSYACAALATKGDIIVENAQANHLTSFLDKLQEIGAGYEVGNYGVRFYYQKPMRSADITTEPHPGFMTDWQPLWAVLASQLTGESVIHEAVYPARFQYIDHLKIMGAKVDLFNPEVSHPDKFYNFNLNEDKPDFYHAVKFIGPTPLKAGEYTCHDLRHGATLVLAALTASGTSTLHMVEHIDRGYEDLDGRLRSMGAKIHRVLESK